MFDKSKIMKRAHSLKKTNAITLSEALKKAWLEAKIDRIETDLFFLDMIDRQSPADRSRVADLTNKLFALKKALRPVPAESPLVNTMALTEAAMRSASRSWKKAA